MKRRNAIKTITACGTVVIAPSMVGVVSGETASGEIELTTDSTIPTNTEISVRINEDTAGDGTADNTEIRTLSGGSGETNTYPGLSGSEGDGNVYWLEINLSTSDENTTPEISLATITLPEDQEEPSEQPDTTNNPQTLDEILDDPLAFIAAVILAFAGIGIGSKSIAIAAWAGYVAFAIFAISTGYTLLQNILYVTLVLVIVGFAFKFWRLEGMGE